MPVDSRPSRPRPHVLATDLDGTLIPLADNSQNCRDLETLRERLAADSITVVFVTGRHLAIVEDVMAEHELPQPDWIICDVGTTMYRQSSVGWHPSSGYADHLAGICAKLPIHELRHELSGFEGLTLQEDEKQGPFKLSYYVAQSDLESLATRIGDWLTKHQAPYCLIPSVDPFTGDGLIDLLPTSVSKAYAIEWWREYGDIDREAIIFAGDSGNDRAALTAGYLSIVVSNADRSLAAQVADDHQRRGLTDRLHLATAPATSGVLEGCRTFGLFD